MSDEIRIRNDEVNVRYCQSAGIWILRSQYDEMRGEIELLRDRIRGMEIDISAMQVGHGEARRLLREAVAGCQHCGRDDWHIRVPIGWVDRAKQAGGE